MELLTKDKALELLSANKILLEEIRKIIGYSSILEESIVNGVDIKWTKDDEGHIWFDRNDEIGNMYKYTPLQISSLGAKGEKLFSGESDGLFYAMAHDEDDTWDNTAIFIFDNANFIEYNEDYEEDEVSEEINWNIANEQGEKRMYRIEVGQIAPEDVDEHIKKIKEMFKTPIPLNFKLPENDI